MTLPALKSLSPDQYAAFRDVVEALVAADGHVDLFEYTVQAVLLHNLDVHFGRVKPPAVALSRPHAALAFPGHGPLDAGLRRPRR